MSRLIDMADAWVLSHGNNNDTINESNMKANIEINTDEIIAAIKDPGFIDLLYKFTKVAKEYLEEEKQKLAAAQLQIVPDKPKALFSDTLANLQKEKSGEIKTSPIKGKPAPRSSRTCEWCKESYIGTNSQRFCSKNCKIEASKNGSGSAAHTGTKHCPACNQYYKPTSNAQKYHTPECKSILLGTANTSQSANTLAPNVPKAPMVHNVPESSEPTPKLSWYQRKKQEEAAAKEEQAMLDSLKEHPKIDWKEVKKDKNPHAEAVNALI